jgi:hypothetical protein
VQVLKKKRGIKRYSVKDEFFFENWKRWMEMGGYTALKTALKEWCVKIEKPVILLIDEIDSLISVLRQIRSGYDKRPDSFPQSVILCGVRDVRDYRIFSDKDQQMITGGSAVEFSCTTENLQGLFEEKTINLKAKPLKKKCMNWHGIIQGGNPGW